MSLAVSEAPAGVGRTACPDPESGSVELGNGSDIAEDTRPGAGKDGDEDLTKTNLTSILPSARKILTRCAISALSTRRRELLAYEIEIRFGEGVRPAGATGTGAAGTAFTGCLVM